MCFGLVKRGRPVKNNEDYAIKIVRTDDEEKISNIKYEFINMKRLSHKNIVQVYELYIDYNLIYMIMEYIQGQ